MVSSRGFLPLTLLRLSHRSNRLVNEEFRQLKRHVHHLHIIIGFKERNVVDTSDLGIMQGVGKYDGREWECSRVLEDRGVIDLLKNVPDQRIVDVIKTSVLVPVEDMELRAIEGGGNIKIVGVGVRCCDYRQGTSAQR